MLRCLDMKHIQRPRRSSGGAYGVVYGTLRVRRRIVGKVATTGEALLYVGWRRLRLWIPRWSFQLDIYMDEDTLAKGYSLSVLALTRW